MVIVACRPAGGHETRPYVSGSARWAGDLQRRVGGLDGRGRARDHLLQL